MADHDSNASQALRDVKTHPSLTPESEASSSEQNRSGCGQLRQPSSEDWTRWKATIIRQYLDNSMTAAAIVQQLRESGYQVTVKMLRDRLRSWGANTKSRGRPAEALATQE